VPRLDDNAPVILNISVTTHFPQSTKQGIGRAIAENLASSGKFSDVILGCRDEHRGALAAKEIAIDPTTSKSCNVSHRQLTIGDKSSHELFRNFIESKYGQVDVLINNAGMAFKIADPTPFKEQCRPTLDVNFRGTADFTNEILPLVRKGDDARIVNVASMAGHLSQLRSKGLQKIFSSPGLTQEELFALVDKFESGVKAGTHASEGWGNTNYGFSKLALIAMTKIWAREEAKNGVSVNCCCPGYCDTDVSAPISFLVTCMLRWLVG